MEQLRSNRARTKIALDGFLYTKQKNMKTGARWICVKRKQCRGALVVERDIYRLTVEHNHPPDDVQIKVTQARQKLKATASATTVQPAALVANLMQDLTREQQSRMKSEDTLKRCIRRQRAAARPPCPKRLDHLVVEGTWARTGVDNEERFLLFDNKSAASRLLVFATDECLKLLASSSTWFMDGNFDLAPKLFLQTYVILVPLGEASISVVYAFMEHKTEQLYREFFQCLFEECEKLGVTADPEKIVTDFEKAPMTAVKRIFGEHVRTQGCFFHLCQSTWRKIQELGLVTRYKTDSDFRDFAGMVDALAFLPMERVEDGMEYLRSMQPRDSGDLLEYFDATYVSGQYRSIMRPNGTVRFRRIPPAFPKEIWNVHDVTLSSEDRTNNISEAWNRRHGCIVGHSQPTIWKAIDSLRAENATVTGKIARCAVGAPPTKRKKTAAKDLQQRLRHLCLAFRDGMKTTGEFLNGIGHTIRF